MLFYGVVSNSLHEALELFRCECLELFASRPVTEAIVQAWDRDEPDQAGLLRVEEIAFF